MCVRSFDGGVVPPVVGTIYTVANLADCDPCVLCGDSAPGFNLREIPVHPFGAWCGCCFKPTWDETDLIAADIADRVRA